jgi:cytoskeletal protein RodZ
MSDDRKPGAPSSEDREETEELLAGFDRPGRTPRAPAVKRDFVEYFKDRETPTAPRVIGVPMAPPAPDPRRAEPTFVVPRVHRRRAPSWLVWAGLLVAMPLVGALVAISVVGRRPSPPVSTSPTLPSAATTITAATEPTTDPSSSPPAPSAFPTLTTPSAAPAAPGDSGAPRRAATPATSGPADPRGDFIRKL